MKLAKPMKPKNRSASARRRASALSDAPRSGPMPAPRLERVGTAVHQRQHVVGVGRLEVPVGRRALRLEPGGPQERRQAAHQPRIVEERRLHRLDAVLERVVLAEGDRDRGVVAVAHGQRALVAQHPERLGQHPLRLGDVAERRVQDDGVEVGVRVPQRPAVTLLERQVRRGPPARGPWPGRPVTGRSRPPGPRPACRRSRAADRPGAAPDLEHPRPSGEADLREVRVEHGALLGIG